MDRASSEAIVKGSAVWGPEMAMVSGADDDLVDEPTTLEGAAAGGCCSSYEPGAWDSVFDAATGTRRGERLCRTCGGLEEDHGEPADSQRRTLIPPGPVPVVDTPEQAAARIAEAMGGPPGLAYYERLRGQVAERLGRDDLTRWEELALRAYVSATAISILQAVVGL